MLRHVARPAVHIARAVPVWAEIAVKSCKPGSVVAFLPAYGRHGAALLRIYNIARALREHGWQSVVLPSTLSLEQRQRLLGALQPQAIVMQGARHALNRPALYDAPVFFDMDDADFHLAHLSDAVAQAMPHVTRVIAGSQYVAQWCQGRGAAAEVVWTGAPVSMRACTSQAQRAPVVAWAQTAPATYEAEADWVLDVMARLSKRCPDVRLRLYDRDDAEGAGFLARFQRLGIQMEWRKKTCYRNYLKSFDDVSLGLAPLCSQTPFSRGKSFGKVLAYLDRHVPVIASDACEHGEFFDAAEDVLSNDPDVWVSQMARLLQDPSARTRMAQSAYDRFQERLSLRVAAQSVDRILRNHLT